MSDQKPIGVFVPLPVNLGMHEAIDAYQGGVTDTGEFLLAIGTPVTHEELYPVGYINEGAIGGLATGIYQSASIFRDEDKEHHDTVAVMRLDIAAAKLADRDAEIARLAAEAEKYQMLLKRIINKASMSCVRTLSGRDSRLLAGACADAHEALKGTEA